MSKFKFVDRGFKKTALLIPGWATDHRVFDRLNIKSNFLIPIEFSIRGFEFDLKAFMRKSGLEKVSIIGWSMGGHIALDFLKNNKGEIDNLILVSVRRRYKGEVIEDIKKSLKKNRRPFLYKFYKDFFSENEAREYDWFRKNLLKSYLNTMRLDGLLEGLDYLSRCKILPVDSKGVKIIVVNGRNDSIVPAEEIKGLKNDFPQSEFFLIEGAGHMPFLNPQFEKIFENNETKDR